MLERTPGAACALLLMWFAFGCGSGPTGPDALLPPTGSTGAGTGVFVWFDSAVWSAAAADLFPTGASSPCVKPLGDAQGPDYFMPGSAPFSDSNGTGFASLRALVTDTDSSMPPGARLGGGNVFTIATSLDPTGTNEFLPWESLTIGGTTGVPECFGSVEHAKSLTYQAFHSYVKGMLDPASGEPAPVSLMLSSYRTLRWGRLLSQSQHLDTDGLYFGGFTGMEAAPGAEKLAPENAGDEAALGGPWSIYWPDNATTSTVDDVDMVLNYTERVIDLANYINDQGDLGPSPVIDLYLDLELFQLSQVAPSGVADGPFGTQYPRIENMPKACLESMGWSSNIPSYWAVPANVADAFWRTLRQVRAKIDAYNGTTKDGDVTLTLSVWSQEAYRFLSPRFGIADTTTSPSSWDTSIGRFNQPFGTAQIRRRSGGTDSQPAYADPVDWVCDCARIDPDSGSGDANYRSKTPMVDDFTINNCIFRYADRVAYGTYQSVPVALVHPKATGPHATSPFRNNTAVDFVGQKTVASPAPDAHTILPGDGVPLGGPEKDQRRIEFARVATFAPTSVQIDSGLFPDGGWLLYPPNAADTGPPSWNPYYYNSISAWPPTTGEPTNTPDWTNFTECSTFGGVYDMPFPGWLPFAARMLTNAAEWAALNPTNTPPSIILTLELTPLDSVQAGASGGACFKNSYGNQWTWGEKSSATSCATGSTTAGNYAWPNYTIDPLCQSDRVSYVFGEAPNVDVTGTPARPISNAWGLEPASRLFTGQNGISSSGAPLELGRWLDPQTPWAFNNHFSYHCLLADGHSELAGFYAQPTEENPTGQRSCWNPWDYAGCAAPNDTGAD